jgi:hypothetical protein
MKSLNFLPYEDTCSTAHDNADDSDTLVTDSDETMSDLPGPGRGIGKLYSRGGRRLEKCISRVAHKLGYGPLAIAKRMEVRLGRLLASKQKKRSSQAGDTSSHCDPIHDKKFKNLCRKLIVHAQYVNLYSTNSCGI